MKLTFGGQGRAEGVRRASGRKLAAQQEVNVLAWRWQTLVFPLWNLGENCGGGGGGMFLLPPVMIVYWVVYWAGGLIFSDRPSEYKNRQPGKWRPSVRPSSAAHIFPQNFWFFALRVWKVFFWFFFSVRWERGRGGCCRPVSKLSDESQRDTWDRLLPVGLLSLALLWGVLIHQCSLFSNQLQNQSAMSAYLLMRKSQLKCFPRKQNQSPL